MRVVEGPFCGQIGLSLRHQSSADRMSMLLEFVNRRTVLDLAAGSVEPLPQRLNDTGQPERSE